jgi:hypothetical protein
VWQTGLRGLLDVKRIFLPAVLVALAFLVASCGGDDSKDSAAPAAATSEPARTEQPATDPGESETAAERPSGARNGDGGSSASDAERAADDGSTAAPAERPAGKEQSQPARTKRDRKLTPQERIAALSPAERRKLHKDLYDQGKRICAAYGPEELAKSIDLPSRDPQTVARLYARAYEAATPSLALPYQQGCLVGFKRYARAHAGN